MPEQTPAIVLIHTSDIHSAFETIPGIAGILRSIRQEHGSERVLTLDCGDHLDRMSPLTEGTEGAVHPVLLAAMGYDAITLGNNEGLTLPPDRLEELYQAPQPYNVLCSNLVRASTGRRPSWLGASVILQRAGFRIGLVAATAPYPLFYELLGWTVLDPLEAVKEELERLRGQTDLIVLLSHLGLNGDKRLAEELPGLDIILGGHSHHVLEEPLRHGHSLLFGCGFLGRFVGEVRLYMDKDTRTLRRAEGKLHRVEDAPRDLETVELLRPLEHRARAALDRPAARLRRALPVDWERDSPLANLLAAGLRKWTGAEIGLINSGQILQSLLPGDVTKGTLLAACPSPVNPVLVSLKGRDLWTALEESLRCEFVRKPLYGNGFRGKELGGLAADGLEVRWLPAGPNGKPPELIEVRVGGRMLDLDAEYRVGTADMFTFGTGYLSLKAGRVIRYLLPEFLRDVLERELRDEAAVADCFRTRFQAL